MVSLDGDDFHIAIGVEIAQGSIEPTACGAYPLDLLAGFELCVQYADEAGSIDVDNLIVLVPQSCIGSGIDLGASRSGDQQRQTAHSRDKQAAHPV